jgi:hypothetical protein
MIRLGSVLVILLAVSGCKSEAEKRAEVAAIEENARAAQRALDDRKAVEERRVAQQVEQDLKKETAAKEALLKQKIMASPGDFLSTSDEQMIAEEPIFGDTTRQLKKMSVTNRTTYPLEGLGGQVQWLSDAGEVRELTTFFLKGSLPGGDTKVFRVEDGTLQSSKTASHAHKLQIKFTSAKFLEIAQ